MWNSKFFEADGVTPLPGVVFVDNTRESNGNGSANNPYNSLENAIETNLSNSITGVDEFGFSVFSRTFVLADGTYSEFNIGVTGSDLMQVEANNKWSVEFLGTGSEYVLNRNFFTNSKFIGVKFIDCAPVFADRSCVLIDSVLHGVDIRNSPSDGDNLGFARCNFVNSEVEITNTTPLPAGDMALKVFKCSFDNSVIQMYFDLDTTGRSGVFIIENSDFNTNCEIRINNVFDFAESVFNNNHFRGTFINIEGGSTAIVETNALTPQDPRYSGNPQILEFVLESDSPLINAGSDGENIGAFDVGQVIDLTVNDEINDLSVSPQITITSGGVGNVIKEIVFDYPIKGLLINYDGNVTNTIIPDSQPTNSPPGVYTYLAQTRASLTDAYTNYTTFKYGKVITTDQNGNGNGHDSFDLATEQEVTIKSVRFDSVFSNPTLNTLFNASNEFVVGNWGQSNREGRSGDTPLHTIPVGTAFEWTGSSKVHLLNDWGGSVPGSDNTYFSDEVFTNSGKIPVHTESATSGSGFGANSGAGNHWGSTGTLYALAKTKLDSALTNIGTQTPLIIISLGERDAQQIDSEPTYTKALAKTAFQDLINRIKTDYPGVIILITELGQLTTGDTAGWQDVRALQNETANEIDNVYISFNNAKNFPAQSKMVDTIHYNFVGNEEMGRANAQFFISLI